MTAATRCWRRAACTSVRPAAAAVGAGRRRRRPRASARGEIVALVGESGCGKTTLARTLLGLEQPVAGQVLVRRHAAALRRDAALKAYRRKVQLVLQDPTGSLNPRHTVYEAVAEGLRIHGCAGRRAGSGWPRRCPGPGCGPPERFFLRYPHELSGGQRQRVVIAGALALEPEVLVADEPVSLARRLGARRDPGAAAALRDELGLSVLVVTHDLGLAWNIADRIAVMYLGRIVEIGPTEQVLADPQHPYTAGAAVGACPRRTTASPIVLAGEPPDPTRIPAGCRFHPRCPRSPRARPRRPAWPTMPHGRLPVLPAGRSHAAACFLSACPARACCPDSRVGQRGEASRAMTSLQAALPALVLRRRRPLAARARRVLHDEWFCVGRLSTHGLDVGSAERLAVVDVAGESVLVTRDRDGRAARVLQRLPPPRVAGRARSTRQRDAAGAVRGGVAALSLPLVDLRPRRPAAAGAAHRGRRRLRPGGLRAAPRSRVDTWGGFLFLHLTPDVADRRCRRARRGDRRSPLPARVARRRARL